MAIASRALHDGYCLDNVKFYDTIAHVGLAVRTSSHMGLTRAVKNLVLVLVFRAVIKHSLSLDSPKTYHMLSKARYTTSCSLLLRVDMLS